MALKVRVKSTKPDDGSGETKQYSFTVNFDYCQPDFTDADTFVVLPPYELGNTDSLGGAGSDKAGFFIISKEQSGCAGCGNKLTGWSDTVNTNISHYQVGGHRYQKIEIRPEQVDENNVGAWRGIF